MSCSIQVDNPQVQAVMDELAGQRNGLADRAATLAGELAIARARVAELEAQLKPDAV
jgi:hypothetical protein